MVDVLSQLRPAGSPAPTIVIASGCSASEQHLVLQKSQEVLEEAKNLEIIIRTKTFPLIKEMVNVARMDTFLQSVQHGYVDHFAERSPKISQFFRNFLLFLRQVLEFDEVIAGATSKLDNLYGDLVNAHIQRANSNVSRETVLNFWRGCGRIQFYGETSSDSASSLESRICGILADEGSVRIVREKTAADLLEERLALMFGGGPSTLAQKAKIFVDIEQHSGKAPAIRQCFDGTPVKIFVAPEQLAELDVICSTLSDVCSQLIFEYASTWNTMMKQGGDAGHSDIQLTTIFHLLSKFKEDTTGLRERVEACVQFLETNGGSDDLKRRAGTLNDIVQEVEAHLSVARSYGVR
jgi:hypothetical protein